MRGLNYSEDGMVRNDGKEDPDGSDRNAGDYQEDAIKAHKHKIADYTVGSKTAGDRVPVSGISSHPNEFYSDDQRESSSETRPKNIALFYYVRIN